MQVISHFGSVAFFVGLLSAEACATSQDAADPAVDAHREPLAVLNGTLTLDCSPGAAAPFVQLHCADQGSIDYTAASTASPRLARCGTRSKLWTECSLTQVVVPYLVQQRTMKTMCVSETGTSSQHSCRPASRLRDYAPSTMAPIAVRPKVAGGTATRASSASTRQASRSGAVAERTT